MKKAFSILLAVLMLLSFSACYGSNPQGENSEQGKSDKDGQDGADGRDIFKMEVIDGDLWVTYADALDAPVNVGSEEGQPQGSDGLAYYPLSDGTYGVMASTTLYQEKIDIRATCNGKPVTKILPEAFANVANLKEVSIPNSVTTICSNAFNNCSSLTSVTIPDSVTTIGNYAFYRCSSLTSVTIPASVTSILDGAFSGCHSLNTVFISDIAVWCKIGFGRTNDPQNEAGRTLYLNGELLTDLVIPNSVTTICSYAFENCSSLTSVVIPNGVTAIGQNAFDSCYNLTSVTIPNSITTIKRYAFNDCRNLTEIHFEGTKAQWESITKDPDWKGPDWDDDTGNYTIYCTDGEIKK